MTKKMNVATATTTNSGKRNNSTNNTTNQMNVENTKFEMAKSESVEYGGQTGESVEVSSQHEDKRIRRSRMYWGHSHTSQNRNRIVLVTNREVSRGALMITYVVIELNEVVGYDENYNAICSYKLNQYRKSAKTYGNYETGYWEIVEGANGVCGCDEITIEDIKKSSVWNYGVLPMDEDTYKKWGEWINAMTSVYGLKAVMVGRDKVDGIVYDKSGKKIETVTNYNDDDNDDVAVVMTAYAVESGDDDNDTQNAIDYYKKKMKSYEMEAALMDVRKCGYLRGNTAINAERLKELTDDVARALGRYYMYKKYVEILSKANEIEELPF